MTKSIHPFEEYNDIIINPLAELKCSYNDIQKVAHIVDFH